MNDRQRAYLKAAYDCDQAAEQNEKSGDWMNRRRRSASEWRWIPYTVDPATGWSTALQNALREKMLVDEGTGATWKALEARGLIISRYDLHSSHRRLENWLFVQMTPLGRKVVRAATGEQREKPLPPGTLREWHWKALTLAYKAGSEGVKGNMWGNYGGIGRNTWLRLLEYKGGSLVEEREAPGSRDLAAWPAKLGEWRIYITGNGREYYERESERYREMYPNVN